MSVRRQGRPTLRHATQTPQRMHPNREETPMHDTDDIGSNQSGNPHLAGHDRRPHPASELPRWITGRRGDGLSSAARRWRRPRREPASAAGCRPRLGFAEVPTSLDDTVVVPAGYTWQVLAPWGTPLLPGAVPFREDASNTAAEQALQVGFNHDGMHYFPLPKFGNCRGLLVAQPRVHGRQPDLQRGAGLDDHQRRGRPREGGEGARRPRRQRDRDPEGLSDGTWDVVAGEPHNRRVTGTTPMQFSGPVAGRPPDAAVEHHAVARSARSTTAPSA